jgi:hypothetical protein
LGLLSEVSEGVSGGSEKLRVRDRRFASFLSGQTIFRREDEMPKNFYELRKPYGGRSALPILLKEYFEKLREGPGLWVSLVIETVWNEFSMLFSFT